MISSAEAALGGPLGGSLSSKEFRSLDIKEPGRSAQRQRLGFQAHLIIYIVHFNLAINITSDVTDSTRFG